MRQLHLTALLTVAVMFFGCSEAEPGLRVNKGDANVLKAARPVFGPPLLLPDGRTLMFPFALESDEPARFVLSSAGGSFVSGSSSLVGSGWSAGQSIHWNNVAFYDPDTEESRLLLDKPAVICRLEMPTANGLMLNGNMLFGIATADTNHDGIINSDDAVQLFKTDNDGQNFKPLTPPDTQIVDLQTFGVYLYIRLRHDSDGDHKFTDRDKIEVYRIKVVDWGALEPVKLDA